MARFLENHPYSFILDKLANKETELTPADLKQVIEKNKLSVVTDEEGGLAAFESLIMQMFDMAETKLVVLQKAMKEVIEREKLAFVEASVKYLCNDLSARLTLKERDELLSLPQFQNSLVHTNSITKEKELRLHAAKADTVLELQREIARKIDEKFL